MAMQYCDSPNHAVGISGSRSCMALSNCAQMSTSVKIGGLWKRSQGISRFTKPNYKHRVFILTDQALSYYGGTLDRVGQLKGRVALDTVRAVEFVDVSAFNLAHALQVVHVSKKSGFMTLYIIATTKEECSDWVATLRQACYFNRDMLMHYHPGAFVKGKWNCCIQRGRTTLGCQPTYHLLTRSSSRYAQMRRKDTLASSTNSQRRAKAGSRVGSLAFTERRSVGNSNAISTDVDDTFGSGVIMSPAGRGLSNSYVELSRHPPHTDDSFTLNSPPSTHQHSRRGSKNSTEPSIGMGTMTLSHVSISEMCACGEAQLEEREGEEEAGLSNGHLSQRQRHSHQQQHYRSERGRKGGRSQVAPVCTSPSPHHLPEQRHSYELEQRTLPRSFKSRSPASTTTATGLNSSWHTASSSAPPRRKARTERAKRTTREGEEPTPVAPPRKKKGSTSSNGHTAPTSDPSSSSQAPPPLSLSSRNISDHTSSHHQPVGLKHSNTFASHPPSVSSPAATHTGGRNFQTKGYGFSRSMGTLAKPLIEPKVSASNPNVIHV